MIYLHNRLIFGAISIHHYIENLFENQKHYMTHINAHCFQKVQVARVETFVMQAKNSFAVTATKTFEKELKNAEI